MPGIAVKVLQWLWILCPTMKVFPLDHTINLLSDIWNHKILLYIVRDKLSTICQSFYNHREFREICYSSELAVIQFPPLTFCTVLPWNAH